MFAKLVKYEVRSTGQIVVFTELIAAAFWLLWLVVGLFDSSLLTAVALLGTKIAAWVGVAVVFLNVGVFYYRSLYGESGYFTAALPVKGSRIVAVKLLAWLVFAILALGIAQLEIALSRRVILGTFAGSFMGTPASSTSMSVGIFAVQMLAMFLSGILFVAASIHLAYRAPLNNFPTAIGFLLGLLVLAVVNQVIVLLALLVVPLSAVIGFNTSTGTVESLQFKAAYTSISEVVSSAPTALNSASQVASLQVPAGSLVWIVLAWVLLGWLAVNTVNHHYNLP